MSRRRYLSTDISIDPRINRLAVQGGDFAAMLYTWMIPHAADDGTITGDPEQLMLVVIPGRRDKSPEDVAAALTAMHDLGIIVWDRDGETISFPPKAFYKHQSYIKDGERRGANNTADQRTDGQRGDGSAEQRKSAQNAASFKSSFSSSSPVSSSFSSPTEETPPTPSPGDAVPTPIGGKKPKAALTPIPDGFVLTPERMGYANEHGIGAPEAADLLEDMRLWSASKNGRYADWDAAWQNWVRRRQREKSPQAPPGTSSNGFTLDQERAFKASVPMLRGVER